MAEPRYDVFLSHNSQDKPTVARIAEKLRQHRLEPWLDSYYMVPGKVFQPGLAEALFASDACAVFLGPHGLGDWQRAELDVAQDRAVKDPAYSLFLVLLPGLPEPFEPARQYAFLNNRTWVDFRQGFERPEQFQPLINAIAGLPMGPAEPVPLAAGVAPYRGLQVFDEAHAEFFFGREAEVQRLLEKLKSSRFLAVVGPSGSGKSSLIRAGLLPALTQAALPGSQEWPVRVFTPGPRPLDTLAAELALADPNRAMGKTLDELRESPRTLDLAATMLLAGAPTAARLVLVVDQFEEVFTLCGEEAERARFLANLLHAATVSDGRTIIILTLRADFYPQCAAYPELATLLATDQVLLGPLDDQGLRAVIERPARRVGASFEPGLVETILADVGREPGSLPLLEHALLELWERRQGTMLTLAGYQESGGVDRALAKRADAVFADLEPAEQAVARRILLRLTQPGEATEDTRRRAGLDELVTRPGEQAAVQHVVNQLVAARLLTTGEQSAAGEVQVDVAHEALIRAWPRLRAWLDEDREGLRIHRRLTEAAQEWERHQRDPDLLYRGARLAEARALAARSPDVLNEQESAFLDASVAVREREEARERQRLAAQERQRRLTVAGLTAFSLIALLLAGLAIWQWRTAAGESVRATAAQEQAEEQARIALVGKLAAQGRSVRQPDLGLLLSLEAGRLQPDSIDAEASLMTRLNAHPGLLKAVGYLPERIGVVAFSQDGTRLAAGDVWGAVLLLDVASGEQVGPRWRADPGAITGLAFNGDGTRLAIISQGAADPTENTVALWNVTPEYLVTLSTVEPVEPIWQVDVGLLDAVAFDPQGSRLAIAYGGGRVDLLDTETGAPAGGPLLMPEADVTTMSFSQDASRLLILSRTGTVSQWDLESASMIDDVWQVNGEVMSDARFSVDGTRLAVAAEVDLRNDEGSVTLWDVERGAQVAEPWLVTSETGWLVQFSPDLTHAVVIDGTGTALVRNLEEGITVGEPWLVHPSLASASALSDDGQTLAVAGDDSTILLWDIDRLSPLAVDWPLDIGSISEVVFDRQGARLAAVTTTGGSAEVLVRNLADWREITGPWQSPVASIPDIALSPDGSLLATVSKESQDAEAVVTLWDTVTAAQVPGPWDGIKGALLVAFQHNGATLVVIAEDGGVTTWYIASGDPVDEPWRLANGIASGAFFGPTGDRLAVTQIITDDRDRGGPDGLAGSVDFWGLDLETGTPFADWSEPQGYAVDVAFSPVDRLAALAVSFGAGNDSEIVLWDTGSETPRGEPLRGHTGHVFSVAFSPDGSRLASAGADGNVILWDVATGEPVGDPLPGPSGAVSSMEFSPDQRYLLVIGSEGLVVWDVAPASWQAKACAIANRELTQQEWLRYLGDVPYHQTCAGDATPAPGGSG